MILLALAALAACQTLPAVIPGGGGAFDVRYDAAQQSVAEVDARARVHCDGAAEFISGETRFDGFAYRTYRCLGSS